MSNLKQWELPSVDAPAKDLNDFLERLKEPYINGDNFNFFRVGKSLQIWQNQVMSDAFNIEDRKRLIKYLELLKENPLDEPDYRIWQWGRDKQ